MNTNAIPDESMDVSTHASDDGSSRTHYAILVDASDLPVEAGKLILQTIRQTRLAPGEQACVAEELIAHFADGLEAGESLDDLIEAFGDTKTTATLIRRAKERCCPRPRFSHIATHAALGLITLAGIGACWFLFIFVTPKIVAINEDIGRELPGYLQGTIRVAEFIHQYWILIVAVMVGAVGLFEWKCKTEFKKAIRTGVLVDLSIFSVAAMIWVALVHVIDLALIAPGG